MTHNRNGPPLARRAGAPNRHAPPYERLAELNADLREAKARLRQVLEAVADKYDIGRIIIVSLSKGSLMASFVDPTRSTCKTTKLVLYLANFFSTFCVSRKDITNSGFPSSVFRTLV